jgi:hypothetical protein
MLETNRKKVYLLACFFRKTCQTVSRSPKEHLTQKTKMKTKASVNTEIRQLTRTLAGYVSRLTSERSTLSEEESALLSARANETMLRLLVLDSELNG